jgi:hypothetical protein
MHFSLPEYPVLIVIRWNGDGSVDRTFGRNGWQEGGYHANPLRRLFWGAAGVVSESVSSVVAYGIAGTFDTPTSSARQPQPALFRIAHPGGLDMTWGQGGAQISRVQEFMPTTMAGAMLASGVVRLACADRLNQPVSAERRSTLGGVMQFR